MEDYGERTTGTRDEHYNLVSVLYHALNGADTCDHYALDAEAAGNERLASFFRETQNMQTQVAERAKELLGIAGSPPEFDVESDSASGGSHTEAEGHQGRGVPPTAGAPNTSPGEENLRGRGIPPMSDAPRTLPPDGDR